MHTIKHMQKKSYSVQKGRRKSFLKDKKLKRENNRKIEVMSILQYQNRTPDHKHPAKKETAKTVEKTATTPWFE